MTRHTQVYTGLKSPKALTRPITESPAPMAKIVFATMGIALIILTIANASL